MGTLIISLCKDYLHLNSFLRCYVLLIFEVNIFKVVQNDLPSCLKKKKKNNLGIFISGCETKKISAFKINCQVKRITYNAAIF